MKVDKLTGLQIEYLQERFGLSIAEIDFTNNITWIRRPDGKPLKKETVAKMLGVNADSPALTQENKWVKVSF